jgi:hypothetical protein
VEEFLYDTFEKELRVRSEEFKRDKPYHRPEARM